jgi:hypothetical protein
MPDRVPVSCYELVGYDTHNFCNKEPSYHALMEYIRERTDCIAMWDPRSNLGYASSAEQVRTERIERKLPDGHETQHIIHIGGRTLSHTSRYINNVYTTWTTESWCKDLDDVDAMLSIPYVPPTYDTSDFARIKAEVGDRGIIMPSLADPAFSAMSLMEFSDSLVWALNEPEHFAKAVEVFHKRGMENLSRMLDACVCDMYRICGPEYMTPPLLPGHCFRRFMTPYLTEMTELIHSKGSLVRLHCHNKIGTVMDEFVKIGVDGTDPCEGPPDGDIELSGVKQAIGDRITLFGNMQLKLLEEGSPDDVRAKTRRIMEAGKPGGRFVIMPTAAPINVPLSLKTQENYIAYIDQALAMAAY